MKIERALELFSSILSQSWPELLEFERYDNTDSLRIDWLQANWEFTVERSLLNWPSFLQFYGEGADCNGASSRVLYPDKIATHEIVCVPRDKPNLSDLITGKTLDHHSVPIYFDYFVRMTDEGWYEEVPEFDCVLARYGEEEVVFKFKDAGFSLLEIAK